LQCGGLLTGVVSWNTGCVVSDKHDVYVDVAFYNEWIEGNLHKKDKLQDIKVEL
jgi:secreted trypsin-like serine protease